jgi:hypothetical protein
MSTWPAIIEIARKCRKKVTGKAAGRRGGGREETRTQCEGRGAKEGRRCDGKRRKTTAMPITARKYQTDFTLNFHSPKEEKNKLS